MNFWKHEGHAPPPDLSRLVRSKWAKVGLVLLILNEIRGLAVAGSVAYAWWG